MNEIIEDIESLIQDIKGFEANRELALAVTKLQEAIHWLQASTVKE